MNFFQGGSPELNCITPIVSLSRVLTSARRLAILLAVPLLMAAATQPSLRQVALLDLPGKPGFDELALAQGMILVTHGGAGTVDLFDPQKRRVVGHIREMSSPRGVVSDEAAHLVYIANSGAKNIVVVSSANWQVLRTIPLDGTPEALYLNAAEHLLYITFPDTQAIAALDLSDGLPVAVVTVDGRPSDFAWDATRQQLYLTLQDRRSVLVLGAELKTVGRFELNASEPTGIVFSAKHDRLYVAVRYAVLALDPSTGQEVSRSAVAGGIDQIVLDEPSNSLIGVSNGSVFIIPDGASLGAADELAVDVKGHTVAYDSATGTIYLPGGREGRSKLLILKRIMAR